MSGTRVTFWLAADGASAASNMGIVFQVRITTSSEIYCLPLPPLGRGGLFAVRRLAVADLLRRRARLLVKCVHVQRAGIQAALLRPDGNQPGGQGGPEVAELFGQLIVGFLGAGKARLVLEQFVDLRPDGFGL